MTVRGAGALVLVLCAGPVAAQSLERRVAAAPDGTVRLTFAARPDVCGDGSNVIAFECRDGRCGHHRVSFGRSFDGDNVDCDCEPGPVRVALTMRGGTVQSLRAYVGGRWKTPLAGAAVTDLGTVSTREATDFLLALAARDDGKTGEAAVFPATLADSVTVWPALLKLARDDRVSHRTRRSAIFWLGQAAGAAAARELAGLVDDAGVDRDVKEQAVFALSQRPQDEAVPALIRIARTHKDHDVRKKAIFWLGQSEDPRALALFEELLTRP